ncbi:MAG: hypothetical protein MK105_17930 [Crocinitomicaceae bacterium]|nr:hypothetical protein [Crocinitomicaceae bacterium]
MRNKLTVLIVVITALISACTNPSVEVKEWSYNDVEYVDSISDLVITDTASFRKAAAYRQLYLGNKKEQIHLKYFHSAYKQSTYDYDEFIFPIKDSAIIFVDTTKFIKSRERELRTIESEDQFDYYFESLIYKSYPVTIENLSSQNINVGYGDNIDLLMQAKDSLGKWQYIEHPYMYMCGTGMMFPYLKPNQILVTACRIYKGDYTTKLRLVFNNVGTGVISNEFVGTINYSQIGEDWTKKW